MPPKKWTKYVCLALEREKIFLCYLRASLLKLKGQKKAEGGCEEKMLVSSRWKNKSLNPAVSTDLKKKKKKSLAISYITRVIKMHFLPILFWEWGLLISSQLAWDSLHHPFIILLPQPQVLPFLPFLFINKNYLDKTDIRCL